MRAVSSHEPLTKRRPSAQRQAAHPFRVVREGAHDGAVVDVEEFDGIVARGRERVLVVGQRHESVQPDGWQLEGVLEGAVEPIKGASPARGGDKYSVEAVRRRLGGDDTSSPSSSNYDLASDEVLIDRDLG